MATSATPDDSNVHSTTARGFTLMYESGNPEAWMKGKSIDPTEVL